jgi:hypothetical protein
MTDPMELVGRAEHFDGAHKRGCEGRNWTCTCGDDETAMNLIAQMAACIREMVEWRPIETAPRDGTRVLLFSVPNEVPSLRPHIADGYWKASTGLMAPGLWMLGQSVGPSFCPTHWLPLPPAPGAQA